MRYNWLLPLFCVTGLLFVRCTTAPLAGGSDNPDFKVLGVVTNENGEPAQGTQVIILPDSYNPSTGKTPGISMIDTTDIHGRYQLTVANTGTYNIQAVNISHRTRLLLTGISVISDTTRIASASLSSPSKIKVTLPSNINSSTGYVFIPGTTILVYLNNNSGYVILDSVPADTIPVIKYSSINNKTSSVIRYNVYTEPDSMSVVNNPQWKYAKKIILNTSATGANVATNIVDFPVLVRLNSGNFDFSQAQLTGADIRFAKSNDVFLPYEIERWDPVNKLAEIWVKTDTVYGNDSTQSLTLYWGNDSAAAASNSAKVFDTAAGFVGVWHLSQSTGTTVPDATFNGFNCSTNATTAVTGIIGMAQMFDGKSSFIRAAGSADEKLNFPDSGNYTVSAWVSANTLDSLYHGIVYKSNFQYGLQIRPENKWEFFTFADGKGWEGSRCPAAAGTWHLLAGVRNGNQQYLYVDGICVDSAKATQSSQLSRATGIPLEIGHCSDGGLEPDRYFSGIIDEVRISRESVSADWIKLCFMNQKNHDILVKW